MVKNPQRSIRNTLILLIFLTSIPPVFASISVTDDRGKTISLSRPAQRIVSLAPHITEDLFAIDAGHLIVGTVSYSD